MKLSDLAKIIERAEARKAKSPAITAVILAYHKELAGNDPVTICRHLGIPESYKHQVRSAMQVTTELGYLKKKVTNS